MKRIVYIVLLVPIFLSSSIFTLLDDEKKYIKSLPNNIVVARRFHQFYQFIHEAHSFSTEKKIIRTNLFINKIIPKNDIGTNAWVSPKEFLIKGFGDCEDYAITKYFALLELGIDENQLFLCVVKIKGTKDFHMVLLYIDDFNTINVLDNLSWKVVQLKERKNLLFQYAFNKHHSFILENNFLKKEHGIKREEIKLLNSF